MLVSTLTNLAIRKCSKIQDALNRKYKFCSGNNLVGEVLFTMSRNCNLSSLIFSFLGCYSLKLEFYFDFSQGLLVKMKKLEKNCSKPCT